MDTADWRTQLQPDSRQRIINKIVETSMKFPVSGPEGLPEVQMIASRFEEKIYAAATSKTDYLRKISMKMLTMETKYHTTGMANTIPSNSAGSAQNPPNPGYYLCENEQLMDCNNWRPFQAEPNMDATDWRTTLQTDSRQRIVNKIMETLKRHHPISGPEGLVELRKIATRFEEKIYTAGTSQSDYLRKISMKMLTMESKSTGRGRRANTIQSNSAGTGSAQNPPDSGQSQIPLSNQPEAWQQLLSQNVENTIANTGIQSSAKLQHQMLSYSTTQTGQDAIDWRWRSTLQPDSRQKQLNWILETLKNCFPICGSVGLVELNKMAEWFEEEIYTAATSHSDYLHKIYLKILKMETRFQTAGMPSTRQSNSVSMQPMKSEMQ